MAHSNNSIVTGKFQGSLGKEIVFRDWEGKTVVAKAPKKRTGQPNASQIQKQEKFLMASQYAKAIVKSEDQGRAKEYAAALRPRQNIYSRAMEDFLNAPVVKSINTRNYKGAVGENISVKATDDFRVVNVYLEIRSAAGELLESGDAVLNTYQLEWVYTAKQPNANVTGTAITAIAKDLPGNEGSLEVKL